MASETKNGVEDLGDGIRCPYCNCGHHEVTQTRKSTKPFWNKKSKVEHIKRYRRCMHCKSTFPTTEIVVPELPKKPNDPAQQQQVAEVLRETVKQLFPKLDINPFLPEK